MLIYITTHCQISQQIFANKLENQVRTIYTHPSSGNEICNALVFQNILENHTSDESFECWPCCRRKRSLSAHCYLRHVLGEPFGINTTR